MIPPAFTLAMEPLRIEPLMADLRMMFAHRCHITWLVATYEEMHR
jgi:hypothetical protein